jgi:hypothetical protein
VKTATTWRRGFAPGAGRRPGSRNKIKREVRVLLQRLERDGEFDPARIFRRLQTLALGDDLGAAIAASRVLLSYRYGLPVSALELDVQHDLGPSVVELLEEIGRSETHRARLEERERRMLAAAITVEGELS